MRISRNALTGTLAGATMALLAAIAPAEAASINLVVNGGFETGNLEGWTFQGYEGGRFYSGTGTTVADTPIAPHSGQDAAQIDVQNIMGQTLSQTLATIPGQTYTLTFWHLYQIADIKHEVGYFDVGWNNEDVHFESYLPSSPLGWTEFTFDVLGTGSDTLSFYYLEGPPNDQGLDDVSVVAGSLPEPGSLALLGLGLAGVIGLRRRRRLHPL